MFKYRLLRHILFFLLLPGVALLLAAPARASSVQQTQQASVTFINAANPQDGTDFAFITDLPGVPLLTLDDANPDDGDGISNTFTTQVNPGSYNVIESAQAGWSLTGINCVKSDPGVGVTVVNNLLFFTIGGNQSLTCTFTNVKTGSITVVKKANPADGTDFSINLGGDRTGQATLDDANPDDGDAVTNSQTFNLVPGNYTLSEAIPAGWNLADLACQTTDTGEPVSVTTNLATIHLNAGEDVTCTFSNARPKASITLIKAATPQDGTDFTFITDIPGNPLITLDDANPDDNDGISNSFTAQVDPGSYNVIEAAQAGWSLSGINCVKSDPSIGVTVSNNLLFFTIGGNQSLTCTFTNVGQGSLTVVKKANPADGTDFNINLDGDRTASVTLDDANPDDGDAVSNSQTFGLAPGNYTLSEAIPAGWGLTDLTCQTTDTGEPVNVATNWAGIHLDRGENVTCTFTNVKMGSITIVKTAHPADGTDFVMELSGNNINASVPLDDANPDDGDAVHNSATYNLPAGTYTLREEILPDWNLTDLTCQTTDTGEPVSIATNQATIHLDQGENVTCTFTNTRFPPDLMISKSHVGNFTQGQTGAQYTMAVRNGGSAPTSGTVTVTDTLPTGLTATALSGTGWSCTLGTLTCTRSDALTAGLNYPDITLTVNVAANAPGSVTNSVTVSGGGEQNTANNTATDPATVNAPAAPICNGQTATIYVNAQGRIVGGPDNGKIYRGKLKGTNGADVIVGTNFSDEIDAEGGNDIVCGGNGNDEIQGGSGNDQLFGEAGRDELKGESGNDILTGGTGADKFKGGSGTDTATDYNRKEGDTRSSIEHL